MSHTGFCNYEHSRFFIPNFNAKHNAIEEIKTKTAIRKSLRGIRALRTVSIVYRPTKGDKIPAVDLILDSFAAITGHRNLWAHHWAVKVGEQFFELTLHPTAQEQAWMREARTPFGSSRPSPPSEASSIGLPDSTLGGTRSKEEIQCWRNRTWPKELIDQIKYEGLVGETYMTDDEIRRIVLGDIVQEGSDIHKQRSGYKVVSAVTAPLRALIRATHHAQHYPEALIEEYDDAFIEYILLCNDLTSSNHFGGFLALSRAVNAEPQPAFADAVGRHGTYRMIHDAYIFHAFLEFLPYISTQSAIPSIESLHTRSGAWNNRAYIPVLMFSAFTSIFSTAYDSILAVIAHPSKTIAQISQPNYWIKLPKTYVPHWDVLNLLMSKRKSDSDSQNASSKRTIFASTARDFWSGKSPLADNLKELHGQMTASGYWPTSEDKNWGDDQDDFGKMPQWMRARAGRYLMKTLFVFVFIAVPLLKDQ